MLSADRLHGDDTKIPILANRLVAPGILAQLSRRYPGLLIQLTWETAAGKLGYLQVEDGERLL